MQDYDNLLDGLIAQNSDGSFSCRACNKLSARRGNMKTHVEMHVRILVCTDLQLCNGVFFRLKGSNSPARSAIRNVNLKVLLASTCQTITTPTPRYRTLDCLDNL